MIDLVSFTPYFPPCFILKQISDISSVNILVCISRRKGTFQKPCHTTILTTKKKSPINVVISYSTGNQKKPRKQKTKNKKTTSKKLKHSATPKEYYSKGAAIMQNTY